MPLVPLRLLRLGFRALGPMAPVTAGSLAEQLWLGTHRSPEPAWEQRIVSGARIRSIPVQRHTIATFEWGAGDAVLLAHGWNGRASQLGAFVTPLAERGYRVIGFDAPGHGRSSGTRSSIVEITRAMRAITDIHGPFQAVLGHSFGGMCAAYALEEGLPVERAVCVASPPSMAWLMRRFARFLRLPPPVLSDLQRRAAQRIGERGWRRLFAGDQASRLDHPALVVHDRHDDIVPWRHGRAFAQSWPGARFLSTNGLGHRRILRDPTVVREVVRFVAGDMERG